MPTWQKLTPEKLAEISQTLPETLWLYAPEAFSGPVVGRYEWRQGSNPDGFNLVTGSRVLAKYVTHVMPFVTPSVPT